MNATKVYYDEIITPIGTLFVLIHKRNVIRIGFGTFHDQEKIVTDWAKRYVPEVVFIRDKGQTAFVTNELAAYFDQRQTKFTFPFKLFGTPFQRKVWQTLYETTEYGATKSYQDLAMAMNHPKAVRAIGGALNKNPLLIVVPCHRIIGKNNQLVGYGGGIEKKQFLLKHEGVYL